MNTDNLKKEIKKIKVWHIALLCGGIFLAFAIIGTVLLLAGGGWKAGEGIHLGNFANIGPGQEFTVNDSQQQSLTGVDNIVIGTVSANVTVLNGGDKVAAELKGTCRSATKPIWLDTHIDGSTLTIEVKYPNSVNNDNTQLTVTIPAEYMGDITIGSVSGSIQAAGQPFKFQQVMLGSVSGDINFGTAAYTKMKAGTTSGHLSISGITAQTTVTTISGDIDLDYSTIAPTTATTVSGSIKAAIPQMAAFAVEFSTVSGGFHSTHPGLNITSADHGFSGSTPDGDTLIKVNTTSGGFRIEGK